MDHPACNNLAQDASPAHHACEKSQEAPTEDAVSRCSTTASFGDESSSGREDHEPATGKDNLAFKEARQIQVEQLVTETGETRVVVDWPVDASKFGSKLRQIISPSFEISPGVSCKLMIHSSTSSYQRGRDFRKAEGKGTIHLKCEANAADHVPQISFTLTIGAEGSWQPKSRPV